MFAHGKATWASCGRVLTSGTQPTPTTKPRGPNWTEANMLVLIEQKRMEWCERHYSDQLVLVRFVCGTMALEKGLGKMHGCCRF